MASDKGKRQKVKQNAGGSQRSQTDRRRSTHQENAVEIEQGAELHAGSVTLEVTPAEKAAGKQRKRPKSVRSVKRECKKKIIAEMDQIVTGLIAKAKQGSYNQAKLLLTIADKDDGKTAEEKAAQTAADASLAKLLLGQLDASPEAAVPAKKRSNRRKAADSSTKDEVAAPSE
jgi:hypothetical protein